MHNDLIVVVPAWVLLAYIARVSASSWPFGACRTPRAAGAATVPA